MQVQAIYEGFRTLIVSYVYGGSVVAGSFEEMCAVMSATFCSYALIALPFIGLYCASRALLRMWRV